MLAAVLLKKLFNFRMTRLHTYSKKDLATFVAGTQDLNSYLTILILTKK
ncbi:MAG: hypothetical protein JWQ04_3282, partial [Pedosphaera sp.]|nr:hypothetical protein [Pedosphaera sp.]